MNAQTKPKKLGTGDFVGKDIFKLNIKPLVNEHLRTGYIEWYSYDNNSIVIQIDRVHFDLEDLVKFKRAIQKPIIDYHEKINNHYYIGKMKIIRFNVGQFTRIEIQLPFLDEDKSFN